MQGKEAVQASQTRHQLPPHASHTPLWASGVLCKWRQPDPEEEEPAPA